MTGRRWLGRDVESMGVGQHLLRLDDRERLPAEFYFVRLTQDGETRLSKVVLAR